MAKLRFVLVVVLSLFIVPSLFAQADQQISATDSADPVVPGVNYTYNIQIQNNGPNPAVNGGVNMSFDGNIEVVSVSPPAGFNCSAPGQVMSCTTPSFASGSSGTVIVTARVASHRLNFPDGSVSAFFSTSGVTSDPNSGNNSVTVTTAWDSPQVDLAVAVTDSPDPVFPDNNITYTAQVTNAGPNTATNLNFNVVNNGSLRFVSAVVPAGWNCTLPAVGAFPTFTCMTPSFASGASSTFTVVLSAQSANIGINDTTVFTGFDVNGTGNDTNTGNNTETEATAYVTPDADMSVSVTDSPDPVLPDGSITYTAQVGNAGPQAATNATFSVYNNGTLRFQSAVVPAGWNCTLPAVDGFPQFTCTNPSFAVGASSTFTVVVKAYSANIGFNDGTVSTVFTASSAVSDPNNGNNAEQEDTLYDAVTANTGITASDSPDPVNAGSNITYTGTITNAGPDAAPNVTVTIPLATNLLFQSFSGPAGFSCTTPAVGANGSIICTAASFANGGSLPFTVVAQVNPTAANGPDGIIQQGFVISAAAGDPVSGNNTLSVFTQYLTPDADLSTTNTDTPDPVTTGGTITYTQSVTNNGPDTAANVTVMEVLPPSVGFVSLVAPAGYSCTTPAVGANGLISCSIASLTSGASGVFTVVVNVISTSGTVGNTITADAVTYDPDPTDDSATTSTTILAATVADLSLTKSTGAAAGTPGSDITYTITLTNSGPDAAAAVVLTDALPAQLLFRSLAVPAGFTCTTPAVDTNGTITCNAATLANGAVATFTLVARVAPGATTGTVTNTASVTSTTSDPDSGDRTGTSGGVTLSATSADLSLTKSTPTTSATPGTDITYTIVVTNSGPDAAATVAMTDTLPAQLLFRSLAAPAGFTCTTPAVDATGTITCNAASLANGATATFTLVARVAPGATSGSLSNTASVSSSTGDPDTGDRTGASGGVLLAPSSANLSLVKTTPATAAITGSTVTYTITVGNSGPNTATNVVVTDTLPAGLQFVSATPSQGSCSGTTTVTCSLGSIINGGSATVSLRATVTANSGTISNTASVTAAETDPQGGNNSSSSTPIPASATPAAEVPTLSEWALLALAAIFAGIAMTRLRL